MKVLERYVLEKPYHTPDAKLRELYREMVNVWYGFNNYNSNVKHIQELCDAIKAEYPDIKEEDMEVWKVLPGKSIRHARYTTVRISLPVEEFIRLRQEHKLSIL